MYAKSVQLVHTKSRSLARLAVLGAIKDWVRHKFNSSTGVLGIRMYYIP